MECQLSTRFSCQCPSCCGAFTTDNTNTNNKDLYFPTQNSTSSSLSSDDSNIINNTIINNISYYSSSTSTTSFYQQQQQQDDVSIITCVLLSSSMSSTLDDQVNQDEDNQDEEIDDEDSVTLLPLDQQEQQEQQREVKRLAKNKKWQKKLRRLNYLERAYFTHGYNTQRPIQHPRRYFNELGVELYEMLELPVPSSFTSRMTKAAACGIFYPKRSEVLFQLNKKNYLLRGKGLSIFQREGSCPESIRLHRPFEQVGAFDGRHYAKIDERGYENRLQKDLHHKHDKKRWFAKKAQKKNEMEQRLQMQELASSTLKNREEEQEQEQERKQQKDDENDDEQEQIEHQQVDEEDQQEAENEMRGWDDTTRSWVYVGAGAHRRANRKQSVKKSKGGKFSILDDFTY